MRVASCAAGHLLRNRRLKALLARPRRDCDSGLICVPSAAFELGVADFRPSPVASAVATAAATICGAACNGEDALGAATQTPRMAVVCALGARALGARARLADDCARPLTEPLTMALLSPWPLSAAATTPGEPLEGMPWRRRRRASLSATASRARTMARPRPLNPNSRKGASVRRHALYSPASVDTRTPLKVSRTRQPLDSSASMEPGVGGAGTRVREI